MTTLLSCFACGEIRPMSDGHISCPCGRSTALVEGSIVEIQGPARVLVPAVDVTTVHGVPWTPMPEEPFVVRRSPAAPLV